MSALLSSNGIESAFVARPQDSYQHDNKPSGWEQPMIYRHSGAVWTAEGLSGLTVRYMTRSLSAKGHIRSCRVFRRHRTGCSK